MPQFTVYRNANRKSKATTPYLLDIQSDLLTDLSTRVVIPVVTLDALGIKPLTRLMPKIDIEGETCVVLAPQLAGVSAKELGQPVGNLSHLRAEILAALDLLFTGF